VSYQTPTHVLRMFKLFGARWPKHPVDETTILVYAIALADVEPGALETAAVQLLRTSSYFPGIDEIRDLANGPKAAHLSAEEAWEEVRDQVRKEGYYGKPKFSSKAIERALDAVGGWLNIATQTIDAAVANRVHFMRIYEAISKSERREEEYESAKEITAHVAGLLGGGVKALYGEDYRDPPEDIDPTAESAEDRKLRVWEEGGEVE